MAFESRLKPPPRSPNCVSSLADPSDRTHWIAPLDVPGDVSEAMDEVRAVITSMPRTTIQASEDDYLHVVFKSAFFRFRDDLEIQVDPDTGTVHVRSAARLGYRDFDANRNRVEAIRAALASP